MDERVVNRGGQGSGRRHLVPRLSFVRVFTISAVLVGVCAYALAAEIPNTACNYGGAATCRDIGNLSCGLALAYGPGCNGQSCISCTGSTALSVWICVTFEGETCDPSGTIDCGPRNVAKCVHVGENDCRCSYIGPTSDTCDSYPTCS